MLTVLVGAGGLALVLVCAALAYMCCCRRRAVAPHLTSVVDPDDAIEGGREGGMEMGKDDILE